MKLLNKATHADYRIGDALDLVAAGVIVAWAYACKDSAYRAGMLTGVFGPDTLTAKITFQEERVTASAVSAFSGEGMDGKNVISPELAFGSLLALRLGLKWLSDTLLTTDQLVGQDYQAPTDTVVVKEEVEVL